MIKCYRESEMSVESQHNQNVKPFKDPNLNFFKKQCATYQEKTFQSWNVQGCASTWQ